MAMDSYKVCMYIHLILHSCFASAESVHSKIVDCRWQTPAKLGLGLGQYPESCLSSPLPVLWLISLASSAFSLSSPLKLQTNFDGHFQT